MAPSVDCTTVKDVTPRTRKHWAVKVRVLEKSHPRTPTNNSRKFQRLILVDKEGTRVQASIFGADIELFANTLKVLHKYHISNAIVAPVEPIHRIVPHNYQWTINKRTPVIEIPLDEEHGIPIPLSLVEFNDFHKYMNAQAQVDVLAVVIGALPKKLVTAEQGEIAAQEFVVVNQELKPMLLTMWDHFIPNEAKHILDRLNEWPIVWAVHLKIGSYNGMSLSTKSSSTFLINPNIPEATALHAWAEQNQKTMKEMMAKKQYLSTARRSTSKNSSKLSQIVDIPDFPYEGKTFKIQAVASIINYEQNFWYMCCNHCQRTINAEYQSDFSCIHCKRLATASPRCRIDVQLEDSSGSIMAVIFGAKAEKLFSTTGISLMEHTTEDGLVDMQYLHNSASGEELMFIIKASRREYRGEITVKFSIICACDKTASP